MNANAARIDLVEAIRYPFREERWPVKAGILALLATIPILNFVVVGYEVEIARRVGLGQTPAMPEWDDLAGHFRQGLRLALARYVYNLPILLVAGAVGAGAILVLVAAADSEFQFPLLMAILGGGFGLLLGMVFVVGAISPAVTVQYVQGKTFASCFDFAAISAHVRRRPSAYLSVLAYYLVLSFGLLAVVFPVSMALAFIPCVGPLAQIVVTMAMILVLVLALAHLEGQLLRAIQ